MARLDNIFFGLFTFLVFVNARQTFPGRTLHRASETQNTYDYVVVGGGLSGLVVANRLSEDPGRQVFSQLTY